MRDARPQGRQIRGAGRDRVLARRRARANIDLALFLDSLARVAGALALHTLAFVVWNVGTRPPLALLADLRAASRDWRAAATVVLAAFVGLIFVVAGSVLVSPIVPDVPLVYGSVETFFVMVALGLEMLVGTSLRAVVGIRVSP